MGGAGAFVSERLQLDQAGPDGMGRRWTLHLIKGYLGLEAGLALVCDHHGQRDSGSQHPGQRAAMTASCAGEPTEGVSRSFQNPHPWSGCQPGSHAGVISDNREDHSHATSLLGSAAGCPHHSSKDSLKQKSPSD